MGFLDLFENKKPIMGMLHLKGKDEQEIFERFKEELDIYLQSDIDAVILEDYFGTYTDLVRALEYTKAQNIGIPYGVNCLNFDSLGFYLAKKYGCAFLQIDSVVGHVMPRDEASLQAFFDMNRADYDGYLLGGVRFKYQPMLSVKSLEEDLEIARTRCDAICVTQDRTGQETSMDKIVEFRRGLADFPLVVAAGVTADNIEKQLAIADAAIIGSYFKDNYKDEGDLCAEHIKIVMNKVKDIRRKLEEEKN